MSIKTDGTANKIQNWFNQFFSGMQKDDVAIPHNLLLNFTDEQQCVRYLAEMRWFGDIKCPICASTENIDISDANNTGFACRFCSNVFYPYTRTDIEDYLDIPVRYWIFSMAFMVFPYSTMSMDYATSVIADTCGVDIKTASILSVRSQIIVGSGVLDKYTYTSNFFNKK